MKVVTKKTSSKGIEFALVTDGVTFGVYKLCENYAAHCRGGLSRTWRYVQKDMDKKSAEALFNRRAK